MTDICLLLEGTFPYVAGGVSTWVYDLIKNLNDITFSIVYLGPHRPGAKKMHYDMPSNVIDFQEYYLFDYAFQTEEKKIRGRADYKIVAEFLKKMKQGNTDLFDDFITSIRNQENETISLYDLAHSYQGWKILQDVHTSEEREPSFIDYFWSWRFIYLPFFALLKTPLPPARVYHTVSTGYAGVLGALCQLEFNRPLILTEHGIYTRERKIEIAHADWIHSETAKQVKVSEEKDFFREWWISLFSFFSQLTYERADEIITLFEGNRQIQIREGASPSKTRIIPNGIDYSYLKSLDRVQNKEKYQIGFMGRVVPIKDVKTFIRACKMVYQERQDVEFFIMGPTDEEPDYYRECVQLTEQENLTNVVHFTGKVKVSDYYPKLDMIVLTSISEAQPIVLLEAMACGIPCVATDVGSCSELLYGRDSDDQHLGKSGLVTPLYSPQQTAQAILKILEDKRLFKQMGETGQRRIERYYQKDDVFAQYQNIYTHYMEEVRWPIEGVVRQVDQVVSGKW